MSAHVLQLAVNKGNTCSSSELVSLALKDTFRKVSRVITATEVGVLAYVSQGVTRQPALAWALLSSCLLHPVLES